MRLASPHQVRTDLMHMMLWELRLLHLSSMILWEANLVFSVWLCTGLNQKIEIPMHMQNYMIVQ